jgi:hypothetical protein
VSKKFLAAALIVASAAFTSGCAQPGDPTISAAPSASPKPSFAAKTPAEAKAAYKQIAKLSCNTAQDIGVVETTPTTTLVSTRKAEAYKDYSAAYFTKPDKYEVVWELTSLASCADWYTFSMSDEAGEEAAIDVTFNQVDGTYNVSQKFDEDKFTYTVTVKDGRIDSEIDTKTKVETKVQYGDLSAGDRVILRTAVDRYLATIG